MAYNDFDKFFKEMAKKPITIRLFGQNWDLPSDLPASTMLIALSAAKEGQSELTKARQMELAIDMLGKKNVEEWCKRGMTMPQLEEVMLWVRAQHEDDSNKSSKGKK